MTGMTTTTVRWFVALGSVGALSIAGCGRSSGGFSGSESTRSPAAALPPGAQAISFRGDTLRDFPLAPAVRARYEQQLAEAHAAYARTPTNVDSIIWMGRRLAYLGRIRESIDVYTKGIALYPDNPWLYRHRGHRYITVRELDRAIADFERATKLVEGKPDEIEPDGQPNAQNQPIGTLHSNIAYHLGLAYYLKGDFAKAVPVYRRSLGEAKNFDQIVSTAHWLYMSQRRLGRNDEAAMALIPISREMEVIENQVYHRLLLLYKGELPVDSVLALTPSGEMSVTDATAAYGVGNWHLYNGRRAEAEAIFRRILAGGQWGAFGYIAAEREMVERGAGPMRPAAASEPSLDAMLARVEAAQLELVRGRPDAFKALWSQRDDVTLIGGLGGSIEKGWAGVSRRLDWVSSQYTEGTRRHEEVTRAVSGDLAYVVQRETIRFRAPGASAETTQELRVTMVFRLESNVWRLAHRHADAQVVRQPSGQ